MRRKNRQPPVPKTMCGAALLTGKTGCSAILPGLMPVPPYVLGRCLTGRRQRASGGDRKALLALKETLDSAVSVVMAPGKSGWVTLLYVSSLF